MASFPYTVLTSDYDQSNVQYFGYTTFLIDAAANSVKVTFPDATTGNDGSFFLFRRHDSSGLGLNTVTLATSNGQSFLLTNGTTASSFTMGNNTTRFILCASPQYLQV
jgi:hypothetical protein